MSTAKFQFFSPSILQFFSPSILSEWNVDAMLFLEPLFAEPCAELCRVNNVAEGLCLGLQVAAFQADDAVGQCIALFLGDVLLDNLDQVG